MPKITKAGGPSHESDIAPPPGFTGIWGDGEPEHPGTGMDAADVEPSEATVEATSLAEHEAESLPRPAANASKADWLAYARQQTGEDIDDGDYTKAELVDLVGRD